MKRRFLVISIFLLAGAVVNVAVAWGFAFTRSLMDLARSTRWGYSSDAPPRWFVGIVDCPLGTIFVMGLSQPPDVGGGIFRDELPAWSVMREPPAPTSTVLGVYELAHGWPAVSLRCALTWHRSNVEELDVARGIPLQASNGTSLWDVRVLPLRPIGPGFAINTLFYATILWLLIPGPFALRRLIRRRRGLCPACAYDLRNAEHEACPECGVTA